MKKLLRRVRGGVVGAVLLACLAWLAGGLVVRSLISREFLIGLAESEINSRVEIGELEISLFRFPARVTLRGVALGPRDTEIGKPPGEREPMTGAPVTVKEARLAVNLGALLGRRFAIREFAFVEPRLSVTLHENGENSLDDLLRTPGGRPDKSGDDPGDPGPTPGAAETGAGEAVNTGSLNIHAHGFLAELSNVRLERGEIEVVIERSGARIRVRNLNARLDEIAVDPAALELTNAARLWIDGQVVVDSADEPGLHYAVLDLDGYSKARLFDPATGDLDPELEADLALGEDSHLNTRIPAVIKTWETLRKLSVIGLQVGELPERATFGRSRAVAVHYHRERFTLSKPVSVWFRDWELAVMDESWIQAETEIHSASGEIVAAAELSRTVRRQLGKILGYLPGEIRTAAVGELEEAWFREQRLVVELTSSGELSDPKVAMENGVPNLRETIRKVGERLRLDLPGLAEELFKRLGK